MIVNEQKFSKKFENHKFYKSLGQIHYNKIFKTISLSQETIQYPYFKL